MRLLSKTIALSQSKARINNIFHYCKTIPFNDFCFNSSYTHSSLAKYVDKYLSLRTCCDERNSRQKNGIFKRKKLKNWMKNENIIKRVTQKFYAKRKHSCKMLKTLPQKAILSEQEIILLNTFLRKTLPLSSSYMEN